MRPVVFCLVVQYSLRFSHILTTPLHSSYNISFSLPRAHPHSLSSYSRDAAYLSHYDSHYTLQPEGSASFLVVTGVNHALSGKATYANVVVETAPVDKGVFNVTCNGRVGVESDGSYEGTADVLNPGGAEVDMLFAFAVARDCAATRERAGNEMLGCMQLEDHMVRGPNPLRIVTRAYLEVETKTGPAYEELVWPTVAEFVCDE